MANNLDHNYKKAIVDLYGKGFNTLIETGTYYGEMVQANIDKFDRIISIELSQKLYTKAVQKFKSHKNVELYLGDSADLLPQILKSLKEPAVFWLDGHYSGGVTVKGKKETPIREELYHILKHPLRHVILIDDARCFGKGDYPTLEEIQAVKGKYSYELKHDIIRLI